MDNNKETPIILWIILGLSFFAPFIGIILAFIVLVFAILYNYKRRILMITLSICAIILPILLWIGLFHFLTKNQNKVFSDAYEQFAENNLTTIVKELEYYKIQNDKYPDNLTQIKSQNTILTFDDPIQTWSKAENKSFYYEVRDSGYFLFSKGQDGIPFTDDDILPKITCEEAQRIGILKCHIDSTSNK